MNFDFILFIYPCNGMYAKIDVSMFLLLATMDLILNYVICGHIKSLPNRESFSSPKFQLDRNLESCDLYCVMNENLHLWEIKTNSLITQVCESSEGLKD